MIDNAHAIMIHDTYVIVDVSEKILLLFRCEREALIDRSVLEIVATDDFRGLVKLRMRMLREIGEVPPVRLPFLRCDGTCFWAMVSMVAAHDDGLYEFIFEEL